jgi:hypothetical protein
MSLKCEFCDIEFTKKYNLIYHQKTSKSCLSKQDKINISFKCNYCDKILTTQTRLNTHINICKIRIKNEDREKEEEYILKLRQKEEEYILKLQEKDREKEEKYRIKLQEKDREKEEYRIKLQEKQEYIMKLEEMLKNANNIIGDIAKQPKNITNSNNRIRTQNIQNNFDINDVQKITNVLENHLTPEVMSQGQRGVAEMLKQHLLQTEQGEPLYECTDVSRQKFEFVNKDGILETDVKANKLINSLNKANIYNKAHSTGQKLWEKEDGSVDHLAQHVHMPKVTEVLEINQDSSKLRSHLASITSR